MDRKFKTTHGEVSLRLSAVVNGGLGAERAALEAMPDGTLAQRAATDQAYREYANHERASRIKQAADLFVAAFLAPEAAPEATEFTPTSTNLCLALFTDKAPEDLPHATRLAKDARVLHWPLAFARIFTPRPLAEEGPGVSAGGFDWVLGNPPWEVSQLGEIEYFATRPPASPPTTPHGHHAREERPGLRPQGHRALRAAVHRLHQVEGAGRERAAALRREAVEVELAKQLVSAV